MGMVVVQAEPTRCLCLFCQRIGPVAVNEETRLVSRLGLHRVSTSPSTLALSHLGTACPPRAWGQARGLWRASRDQVPVYRGPSTHWAKFRVWLPVVVAGRLLRVQAL